jgi:hypothetical protein
MLLLASSLGKYELDITEKYGDGTVMMHWHALPIPSTYCTVVRHKKDRGMIHLKTKQNMQTKQNKT